MNITVTKEFAKELKTSRNVLFRFGPFPKIEMFFEGERMSIYTANAGTHLKQSGDWYTYATDVTLLANIVKEGDLLTFQMVDNTSEEMKPTGFKWMQVNVSLSRVSKTTGRTLKQFTVPMESMVAKASSTNFKDLVLSNAY